MFLDMACGGDHGILTTRSLTKFSSECICVIFMATYTQDALAIMLVNAQLLAISTCLQQVSSIKWLISNQENKKYRKANNRELTFLTITVKFFQIRQ